MSAFNESIVEDAALDYLRQLGYSTAFGPEIAPDGELSERSSYEQVYFTAVCAKRHCGSTAEPTGRWSMRRSSGWGVPSHRTRSTRTSVSTSCSPRACPSSTVARTARSARAASG